MAGQVTFNLPTPSFALRAGIEGNVQSGLEEVLHPAAGLEEKVPITIEGPDGSITWEASAPIAQAIHAIAEGSLTHEEGGRVIREILKHAEEEADDENYGQASFYMLERQQLIFWILEYLHDPSDLTPEVQDQLEIGLYDTIAYLSGRSSSDSPFDVFSFSEFGNHAIDAWWYLLVRVLVIDAARQGHLPQGLEMIQNTYRVILHEMSMAFQFGLISHGKQFFEGRLIALAKSQPSLEEATQVLLQHWDDWAETDVVALSMAIAHRLKDAGIAERSADALVQEAQQRQWVREQLLTLRKALEPQTPEAIAAWGRPVQHLVDMASKSEIAVFEPIVYLTLKRGELPNALLFQLDWLDRMAQQGFTRWIFSGLFAYAGPLHVWWNQQSAATDRPLSAIVERLAAYLNHRAGMPIRAFLGTPRVEEPPPVTAALKFFEELRGIIQTRNVSITWVNSGHTLVGSMVLMRPGEPQTSERAAQWLQGGGQWSTISRYPEGFDRELASRRITVIAQSLAAADYRYDFVFPRPAIRYVGHQMAEHDRGWGDRRSIAIPIQGNQALADFFQRLTVPEHQRKELYARGENSQASSAFHAKDWDEEYGYLAALVLTSEPEGDESEEPWEPTPEEVFAPGPRVLVPAGSRGGLEEQRVAMVRAQESWHGIRSQVPLGMTPVVISRVAQEMHPQLAALGGLEEKSFILDQGDPAATVVKLIELNATSAVFVGLEEEEEHFAPMAQRAGIAVRKVSPGEQGFSRLMLKILSEATGLEESFIESQRSFQQFAAGLESLATGA